MARHALPDVNDAGIIPVPEHAGIVGVPKINGVPEPYAFYERGSKLLKFERTHARHEYPNPDKPTLPDSGDPRVMAHQGYFDRDGNYRNGFHFHIVDNLGALVAVPVQEGA